MTGDNKCVKFLLFHYSAKAHQGQILASGVRAVSCGVVDASTLWCNAPEVTGVTIGLSSETERKLLRLSVAAHRVSPSASGM